MVVRSSLLRLAGSLLGLCLILAPVLAEAQATEPGAIPPSRRGSGLPIPALRVAPLRRGQCPHRPRHALSPSTGCSSARACRWRIVAEYENWRKIRDWQGASGWVHQSLLAGKRDFIIPTKVVSLHRTPAVSAEVVAKLEPEVMGEIRSCSGDWCRVKVSGNGVSGWLERTDFWGVYKSEPIN